MFLLVLILILVVAGLGRLLSRATKQPVILGELILGMFLGNIYLLARTVPTLELIEWLNQYNIDISGVKNPIPIGDPLLRLADIGIILLLFSIGLGMAFEEVKRVKIPSSVVAVSVCDCAYGS